MKKLLKSTIINRTKKKKRLSLDFARQNSTDCSPVDLKVTGSKMQTIEQFYFSIQAIINIALLKACNYMNKGDNVLTQEKGASVIPDELGKRDQINMFSQTSSAHFLKIFRFLEDSTP